MNDSSQREREITHWQQWHDRADDLWGWRTPSGRVRASRRTDLFLQLAHMTRASIVLEIGCGSGEYSHRLAPHVKELHATDISPELLDRARARLRECCPEARVVVETQDASALTYPGDMFDAVYGCSILHHVDAGKSLREVGRVLKPGGWCIFSEPNMANPQILLQKNIRWIKRRVGDTDDETAFFSSQVRRFLQEAGFCNIEVRHFDFLHPATPARCVPFIDRLGKMLEKLPVIRWISGSLLFWAQKPPGTPPS